MQIDWPEYSSVHARRTNLLIHLFAVPLFVGSVISLFLYMVRGDWVSAVIVIIFALVAMALQGHGHRLEAESPRPFSSPLNFVRRWFTEQFFLFPLFLVSGRWWQQFRAAGKQHNDES